MIAVITAHKEGKRIEAINKIGADRKWEYAPKPCWDFMTFNYRSTRTPRKVWIKWAVPASCAPWESVISKNPHEPSWQEVTEQL